MPFEFAFLDWLYQFREICIQVVHSVKYITL